jgi:hypothetical protein
MWWWAEVSAVDQRHQPRLGAAASCSLAVADVQLAEPAQLPAHVVQVEHADLVDPQADVGLQPRGRVVSRGRDELAAGGQFLAPTGEQPLDLRLGRRDAYLRHGHIRDESAPFSQKAAQNWSVCAQDPCCNPPAAAGHSRQ